MDQRPIAAVFCDFQCHPELDIEPESLAKLGAQSGMIREVLVFNKACEIQPVQLARLRGKKIVFVGCPHMEESGFFDRVARQLRTTEFLTFDAVTNTFLRYEKTAAIDKILGRQTEALVEILARAEPYSDRMITPNHRSLVYGSGLSGLSAATELAKEGLAVDVVETPEDTISPGCLGLIQQDPNIIRRCREEAQATGKIHFLQPASVKSLTPIEGGFILITETMAVREYGTVVFAPERREEANGEIGSWTVSQLFSELAAGRSVKGRVVFVLGLGDQTKPEMFRDVLIAARRLRQKMCAEVSILLQNARVSLPGAQELYDECRELGIVFIKYPDIVRIENDHGDFIIQAVDSSTNAAFTIEYPDKLILPGKIALPPAAKAFAQLLKLRLTREYYSQPDSLWQSPHESNRAGVFVVGTARGNMDFNTIREDAAALVYTVRKRLVAHGVQVEECIPVVDEEKCAYCLTCVRICPFGAMKGDPEHRVASVVKSACHACGSCAAECPAEAIQIRNLSTPAIRSGLKALAG